jgi:hypothetical protein
MRLLETAADAHGDLDTAAPRMLVMRNRPDDDRRRCRAPATR